ncbi:MAG TPA: alpha/beta fold hydrolase [Polyangiaceae bacterium]|nr:alpha/beta fold hydrolase [Polyangiaceae bacterium]
MKLDAEGISIHYEVLGARGKPPVLLVAGLGGAGASWGEQVGRFAQEHFVILPDQRGTGKTTHAKEGYTISQLAKDFAALVRHVDAGPVHVVGSSTGGTIAQLMALDHRDTVRTITLSSSFARPDAWVRREFALRRKLLAEADARATFECYALFLFWPRFHRDHADHVGAWIDRCVAATPERDIALARTDMIMAHDSFSRLGEIDVPTLVIGGANDFCTPPQLSDELEANIRGAERVVLEGGHMIHDEAPDAYARAVQSFLARR